MLGIGPYHLFVRIRSAVLLAKLDQVDAAFIEKLCVDRCPESNTLDFKRDLPGSSNQDKHEVLKDVSALANADGGDLIYGVDELDGGAARVVPITAETADEAMRRIAQVVDAGIEPRIPGLQIRSVAFSVGCVLVLRVPASFLAPHSIRTNNSRRFVMRNGTTTTDLSMDQLRSAFDRTATLTGQAHRFIEQRLHSITRISPGPPKRMVLGPWSVIHLLPIAGLAGRLSVDLQELNDSFVRFLQPDWGGGSRSFNLDGLVVYPGDTDKDGGHDGYCQAFRNGAIEAASVAGHVWTPPYGGAPKEIVSSRQLSVFFREQTKTLLAAVRDWGFTGPAVLSFALLQVKDYELGIDSPFGRRREPKADREDLVVPGLWIDDLETVEVDVVARPLLDTLWQGFGVERCLDFDPRTGAFALRR